MQSQKEGCKKKFNYNYNHLFFLMTHSECLLSVCTVCSFTSLLFLMQHQQPVVHSKEQLNTQALSARTAQLSGLGTASSQAALSDLTESNTFSKWFQLLIQDHVSSWHCIVKPGPSCNISFQ